MDIFSIPFIANYKMYIFEKLIYSRESFSVFFEKTATDSESFCTFAPRMEYIAPCI